MEKTGIITSVQRMSIHDGPGIRSTVFFKGCNMRCGWCHNPETWSPVPQHQYIAGKCIGCGSCMSVCPHNYLAVSAAGISVDSSGCSLCRRCEGACPAGALMVTGRTYSVGELVKILVRDRVFFETSGGGVTLSGGEPFAQKDFTISLLRALKDENIHTAIETNLHTDKRTLDKAISYTDLWLCDIKVFDGGAHKMWTGADNRKIKDNLSYLSAQGVEVVVRTTVVPGVNDTIEQIAKICDFLITIGVTRYELQPFHSLGFGKFEMFSITNPLSGLAAMEPRQLMALNETVRSKGLKTK